MVLDIQEPPIRSPSPESYFDQDALESLEQTNKHKGLRTLHISHLLQMVLQDAQTRLFFKAQSVVQSEIRYYVPKPEDLAYPDKLIGLLFLRWHPAIVFDPFPLFLAARKPTTSNDIQEDRKSVV